MISTRSGTSCSTPRRPARVHAHGRSCRRHAFGSRAGRPRARARAVLPAGGARPGMSVFARPCAWSLAPRPASSAPADLVERILAAVPASFGSSTLPIGQTKPATKHWRIGLPLGAAIAAAAAVFVLVVVPITWERKRLDAGQARVANDQPSGVSGPRVSGKSTAALTSRRRWRARPRRPGTWRSPRRSPPPGWAAACSVAATEARIESSGRSRSEPPAAGPGESIAAGLPSMPSLFQGLPDSPPGSALFQEVGDSLSATVRPLSSTARQAFGFLRTPSLEKNDNRISPPASKGA